MKLRPYQIDCVQRIAQNFEERNSTLVVLPTGTGKTIIFASVIKDAVAAGRRCLVIAHRSELIHQACQKIHAVTGIMPDIEMAELRAARGFFRASVVVGTVQTLGLQSSGRMNSMGEFGLLVIDEAHRGIARSYRTVIDRIRERNPYAKLLGVTATPDRSDELALGQVFESVAFDMNVADAVRDGWLVNVKQKFIRCDSLDISRVKTRAGDLAQEELDAILERDQVIQEMVDPLFRECKDRRCLVFCSSCAQSEHVKEVLNAKKHNCAAVVNGETPTIDRAATFKAFSEGKIQYLVNVAIATEGWDDPAEDGRGVQAIAMMRPTKSRALYAQSIGRGTRPLPAINTVLGDIESAAERCKLIAASDKPFVTIFDFVGNAGRHHLIHASDVLGGKYPEEMAEAVEKDIEESDEETDVIAALDQKVIEEEERLKRERESKWAPVRNVVKASYQTEDVDPFRFMGLVPRRVPAWLKKPLTERQAELLRKAKIPNYLKLNLGEASQIIDQIMKKPSDAQAWVLRKHGRDPTKFDRKSASAEIDKIKSGGG